MTFEYDDDNQQHRAALAMAILALEAEDLVEYPSECELTPEGYAKVMQVLASGALEGARGNGSKALAVYSQIAREAN